MQEIVFTAAYARRSTKTTHYILIPRELIKKGVIDPEKPMRVTIQQ